MTATTAPSRSEDGGFGLIGEERVDAVQDDVAQLVADAAGGNREAWDRLVTRFSPMVWAVARSCGLGPADAAEVVQTTWMRLVDRLDTIRQRERIGAWLATTTRREAVKVATRQRALMLTDDDRHFGTESVAEAPGARLAIEERDRLLHRAFMRLPARGRVLLTMLTYDDAMSYRDISEALDMPIGSIGPTRGRYLAMLRAHAIALGLSADDLA